MEVDEPTPRGLASTSSAGASLEDDTNPGDDTGDGEPEEETSREPVWTVLTRPVRGELWYEEGDRYPTVGTNRGISSNGEAIVGSGSQVGGRLVTGFLDSLR